MHLLLEIAWLKSLLVEIDVQLPFRIVIWSDNLGATCHRMLQMTLPMGLHRRREASGDSWSHLH